MIGWADGLHAALSPYYEPDLKVNNTAKSNVKYLQTSMDFSLSGVSDTFMVELERMISSNSRSWNAIGELNPSMLTTAHLHPKLVTQAETIDHHH